MTIIIDEKGICNGSLLYPWSRIDHCYYYKRSIDGGRIVEVGLAIVKKNKDRVHLKLYGFRFKLKELMPQLIMYSERKICHMSFKDENMRLASIWLLLSLCFLSCLSSSSYFPRESDGSFIGVNLGLFF